MGKGGAAAFMDHLPGDVVHLLRTRTTAEFATLSAAGVPIDTPSFFFPSADLSTLDLGTGLAYPAKAERARRNARVGLLVEGGPDQPVVSIAGVAAVRDRDLQANLDRYLRETLYSPNTDPALNDWPEMRDRMLYYLTRIIISVKPARVRWWPSPAAMEELPGEWRAPVGTSFPASDPAPPGNSSPAPQWEQPCWRDLRERALRGGSAAHLTLVDPDGYPAPIRVRSRERHERGFLLDVPAAAPWHGGRATLSFIGKEIFVGEVTRAGGRALFAAERALPVWPLMTEKVASAQTHGALTRRLEQELQRRGLALPVVPAQPPEPTEGARLRRPGYVALRRAPLD